jgi:3-dehydroquinate synthase
MASNAGPEALVAACATRHRLCSALVIVSDNPAPSKCAPSISLCFPVFHLHKLQALGWALTQSSDPERTMADPRACAIGAALFVQSRQTSNGVFRSDDAGHAVLTLTTSSRVSYQVIHSPTYVFHPTDDTLAHCADSKQVLFAIDSRVDALYGNDLRTYANRRLHSADCISIDPTDQSKCWGQVERICGEAVRVSLPRDGIIVAVGGGVTLDIAGVAAALYRRGVGYLRIPTTLVGLIDVCVGVKHGINFLGRKNLLGTYYPPLAGINDISFLHTLARREIACGLAEMIKIAIMRDALLFEKIERCGSELLDSHFQIPAGINTEILVHAEHLMMADLQSNLFEKDYRRFPDFGHTFGPMLEMATRFQCPHGEAVAIDIMLSTIMAVQRGLCSREDLRRIASLYAALGLPHTHPALSLSVCERALRAARLQRGGSLNLVVPTGIGAGCFLQQLDTSDLESALAAARELGQIQRYSSHASAGV